MKKVNGDGDAYVEVEVDVTVLDNKQLIALVLSMQDVTIIENELRERLEQYVDMYGDHLEVFNTWQ